MNKTNMDKMLQTASKQLGISAEELKELMRKGDMNAIMEKMNSSDSQKLKDALKDPNIAKKMKDSPEMAKFMKDKV